MACRGDGVLIDAARATVESPGARIGSVVWYYLPDAIDAERGGVVG